MSDDGAVGTISEPRTQVLRIHLDLHPRINLAMQQNAVPVVPHLRIENISDQRLEGLDVTLHIEPDLAQPRTYRLAAIDAGATWNLASVDIPLMPERLVNVTEREAGTLWVEVKAGEEQLHRESFPVEILAYNEWAGPSSLPENLAAFVLPNHAEVEVVLRTARTHLEAWTKNPAFDAYQSGDPRRARMQAAAVYTAIADLDITYVAMPASFEERGQKVHTPELILQSRMANCLDLTLLLAACMEQAGLRPFLVMQKGHAFPGLWIQEHSLKEPVALEASTLRKRLNLGEAVFFDSSAAAARPRVPFEQAEKLAREELSHDEKFNFAVDVHVARTRRILPLPARRMRDAFATDPAPQLVCPTAPTESASLSRALKSVAPQATVEREPPARRLERWKTRLLDLSLRNKLLNFRSTSTTIPLLCPDASALHEVLAANEAVSILPREVEADPRDPTLHAKQTGAVLKDEILRGELALKRVRADLTQSEMEKRLVALWRDARSSLEETGANTLYLALGFLKWYETPASDDPRVAPILLIPIELVRGAAGEPYRLRGRDDEARINVTLLEKLRRDYNLLVNGMDDLATDHAAVDIPRVFNAIRKAIVEIDRWELVEWAHVGLFSFTKFLMWKDLQDRAATLLENPVVRNLVECGRNGFPAVSFPSPEALDATVDPATVFCPLDADSSQLSAIVAGQQDASFVLQGPPGTGKSQTITNLIAQALSQGRTVLFVGEKRAALEVVHQRLTKVGLQPFCLELHSNKTSKSEVMAQLKTALDVAREADPADWAMKAEQLSKLREELNTYVAAIHDPQPLGRTVFEITSELIGLREVPRIALRIPDIEGLDRKLFLSAEESIAGLQAAARDVEPAGAHPLRGVQAVDWNPSFQQSTAEQLERLAGNVATVQQTLNAVLSILPFPATTWSREDLDALAGFCEVVPSAPSTPAALLRDPGFAVIQMKIARWIEQGRQRNKLWDDLAARYTPPLLTQPVAQLQRQFQDNLTTFALLRWVRLFRPRRALASIAKGPLADNKTIAQDLASAQQILDIDRALQAVEAEARHFLGSLWSGVETDWDGVARTLQWASSGRRSLAWVSERFPTEASSIIDRIVLLVADAEVNLGSTSPTVARLSDFRRSLEVLKASQQPLDRSLALSPQVWAGPDFLSAIAERVALWRRELHRMRDWIAYVSASARVEAHHVAAIGKAHLDGSVRTEQLPACFRRSFFEEWLTRVMSLDPRLGGFRAPEHEQRMAQFRRIDLDLLKLTKQALRARLVSRLPATNGAVQGSELAFLQRELVKKTRHTALRKLFQNIPHVLHRLKPCFLMSPLSVAQYLDPAMQPFDLIVFDEASQIPTWDAVGAIARGRQLIVVGDSKQLPPTQFFSVGDTDDISDEDVEETESILDECEASRMSVHLLRWHYRSRHESLIAFSNYHYYDRRLLTFPSAARDVPTLGVKLSPVQGVYDRGVSRTNRAEANAVVAEVVRHLKDPARREKSMGVVTFNIQQQTLIEDLLDLERRQHPEIEPYFADKFHEPVFVKNLENVQGDERDVILFSITYGPDEKGRVAMNFGPLNRTGGERRLNVAITRARELLKVFSVLRADQIDPSRVTARGPLHLRTFLDYAARGEKAIQEAVSLDVSADYESPFEEAVGRALEARGWTVHRQVGCSGYRIDLAIVHPEHSGTYLIGIECDGATYHSARAARDRDRLRESVLRDLGWRLHRIWSTEWWIDFRRQLDLAEAAIRNALSDTETGAAPSSAPAAEEPPPETAVTGSPEVSDAPQHVTRAVQLQVPVESTTRSIPPGAEPYRRKPVDSLWGTPEAFYPPWADGKVRNILVDIVRLEGPISVKEATRRVAAFWGMGKAGAQILKRVQRIAALARGEIVERADFFWRADQDPKTWRTFRVPSNAEERREIEDICLEERANAIEAVLKIALGISLDNLVRETARVLGFQQTGARVRQRLEEAVGYLARSGRCKVDGTSVSSLE